MKTHELIDLADAPGTLVEHKDWLDEIDTQKMCEDVVAHLKKKAKEYKKREDYKDDDPIKHVRKELFDKIEEMLK